MSCRESHISIFGRLLLYYQYQSPFRPFQCLAQIPATCNINGRAVSVLVTAGASFQSPASQTALHLLGTAVRVDD